MQKVLVVYFSHKGENWKGDDLVELKKGNTEIVAEICAKVTDGDLFEIVPKNEYPDPYKECIAVAKDELKKGTRPEIVKDLDTDSYDVIILGYPCWWGTMPMPVFTFLEKHNLFGKVILPFCTHEGSGMGTSEKDLKKLESSSIVKNGLPIRGTQARESEEKIVAWLNANGVVTK